MIPYDLYVQHDHLGNAPKLLAPADAARVYADRPDWFRASGACVCEACGKLYYDHPPCSARSGSPACATTPS